MHKELVKLANHLDNNGHRDLADRLDSVVKDSLLKKAAYDTNIGVDIQSASLNRPGLWFQGPLHALDEGDWKNAGDNKPLARILKVPNDGSIGLRLGQYITPSSQLWGDYLQSRKSKGLPNTTEAEQKHEGKMKDMIEDRRRPIKSPESRAMAHESSQTPIHRIQRIIGTDDDGDWGGLTQKAYKKFLTDKKELIAVKDGDYTVAYSWKTGHSKVGVLKRDGSFLIKPGELGNTQGDILRFVSALHTQSLANEQVAKQKDTINEAAKEEIEKSKEHGMNPVRPGTTSFEPPQGETGAAAVQPAPAPATGGATTIPDNQKEKVIKMLSRGLGGSAREDAGLINTWTIEGQRDAAIRYIIKNSPSDEGMNPEAAEAIVANLEREARKNMGMKEASTQEELINKRAEDLSRLFSIQDIPSVRR